MSARDGGLQRIRTDVSHSQVRTVLFESVVDPVDVMFVDFALFKMARTDISPEARVVALRGRK
jgi:hypothetical protein